MWKCIIIAILIIAMLVYTIYIAIDEAKNSMEIVEALMNFGEEEDNNSKEE